jgi:hypothetical protein
VPGLTLGKKVKILYHVCYPRLGIKILETESHHLLSLMMGFTMVDPPSIARRKSILHKMLTHVHLVLPFFLFAQIMQGHKTRNACANAISKKSLVFIIHSSVKSPALRQPVYIHSRSSIL